jgi:hypothetical protein
MDVRPTAWRHPDTDALVYLETEYHPDARNDTYFVAWIESDGNWPVQESFEDYGEAERYARDLVLTYTDGVL